MQNKTLLVAIYPHPEAYPPTLNAIDQLAERYTTIWVVCRNTLPSFWAYPNNVKMVYTTKPYDTYQIEQINLVLKFWYFIKFTFTLLYIRRKNKVETILCYDVIPLFSIYLLKKMRLLRDEKIWYHNHDTVDMHKCKKFSVLWFAAPTKAK